MTAETRDLILDLRATLTELKPLANHENREFSDDLLALGVLLRREIEMAKKTRMIEPAYAEGAEPQRSVGRRYFVDPMPNYGSSGDEA
jgi:hypothetical protein